MVVLTNVRSKCHVMTASSASMAVAEVLSGMLRRGDVFVGPSWRLERTQPRRSGPRRVSRRLAHWVWFMH